MKYAWDVFRSTLKARLCGMQLFYDRKFDVDPQPAAHSDKLDFVSSQRFAVDACLPGRHVLQLGIGQGNVARELEKKLCHVTAVDYASSELSSGLTSFGGPAPVPLIPAQLARYDQILLMDLVEHL